MRSPPRSETALSLAHRCNRGAAPSTADLVADPDVVSVAPFHLLSAVAFRIGPDRFAQDMQGIDAPHSLGYPVSTVAPSASVLIAPLRSCASTVANSAANPVPQARVRRLVRLEAWHCEVVLETGRSEVTWS